MTRKRTQYSTTSPNYLHLDPWTRYMTTIRANALDVVDRSSVKVGDTVPRPGGTPQRVVASYPAARADNTWVLEYEDGTFSMAGYLYPVQILQEG